LEDLFLERQKEQFCGFHERRAWVVIFSGCELVELAAAFIDRAPIQLIFVLIVSKEGALTSRGAQLSAQSQQTLNKMCRPPANHRKVLSEAQPQDNACTDMLLAAG
jgi:hypothetical protein